MTAAPQDRIPGGHAQPHAAPVLTARPYPPAVPSAHPQVCAPPAARLNGFGVAGFVTGLAGLLLFWMPSLGLLLAGSGILLGGLGLATAGRSRTKRGLALAGLVLGIVAVVPALIYISVVRAITEGISGVLDISSWN